MDVLIKIDVEGSSAAEIHREARSFSQLASSQPDLAISRPEDAPPKPGQKGAGMELGTIVVGLVTSGAVTALINVLKAYFERDRKVSVTIKNPDGTEFVVDASNMRPDRIRETIDAMQGGLPGPA